MSNWFGVFYGVLLNFQLLFHYCFIDSLNCGDEIINYIQTKATRIKSFIYQSFYSSIICSVYKINSFYVIRFLIIMLTIFIIKYHVIYKLELCVKPFKNSLKIKNDLMGRFRIEIEYKKKEHVVYTLNPRTKITWLELKTKKVQFKICFYFVFMLFLFHNISFIIINAKSRAYQILSFPRLSRIILAEKTNPIVIS